MGECRCAAALLWLRYVPNIGLAIGPRQSFWYFLFGDGLKGNL